MPASLGAITPFEFETHGGQHHLRVVVTDLGNGHREASITPYRTLAELPTGFDPIAGWSGPDVPTVRGEGDLEASRKRSRRRASRAVRHRCKGAGYNSLFTFTFRENVTDRELVLDIWQRVVRRIRVLLPTFSYIAVLERQKRGAWHIHVGTHRLPAQLQQRGVKVKSWALLRAIWRDECGPLGGNFDEQKTRRQGRSRASAFRIARYIAGYVAKDFDECPLNRKRYWSGGDVAKPTRVTMLFPSPHAGRLSALDPGSIPVDLLALVFDDAVPPAAEYSHWLHPGGICYWVASCAPPA